VWDSLEKIWQHKKGFNQISFNNEGNFFPYGTGKSNLEWPNRFIVQQYTGLKDEDGIEVYEGDIVIWTEYQGWEDGRTFEGRYEVKWNENDLRFDFYDIHENSWWPLADTQFNNVVGNIFQNPELLK
jgi:uncharacterized phage protein (TIGR01671 family)